MRQATHPPPPAGPCNHQLTNYQLPKLHPTICTRWPQVRLVLEYCDRGCLRDALDAGAFFSGGWAGGLLPLISFLMTFWPAHGMRAWKIRHLPPCSTSPPPSGQHTAPIGDKTADPGPAGLVACPQSSSQQRLPAGCALEMGGWGPPVSSDGAGPPRAGHPTPNCRPPAAEGINYRAILDTAADIAKAMLVSWGGWGRACVRACLHGYEVLTRPTAPCFPCSSRPQCSTSTRHQCCTQTSRCAPPPSASILRRSRRDRDETANLAICNRDEPGGEHVSIAMKSGRPAGPVAYLEGRLRPYGSR